MCAGRCREPRRKGTRVAAPSGCVVPWAARASCWPQPQQLLPVSAAGSGRRCCTGAFLPAGLFGGSMLFESTLAAPFARQIKQKLQYPVRILESLVGAGGFEPPKLKAADLQSVPIGHSGTRPYLFLQSRGLPVYVTTESAICQPIIWAEGKNIYNNHKSPPIRVCFTASRREGFSA